MGTHYKTCLEMLQQRKYSIINENEERILALKPDNNQLLVFFSQVPKFNVKTIQLYISEMNSKNINHAIIIYKNSVTSFTRKTINKSLALTFELFSQKDLQYNITKHRLQPHFERLSLKECENFKKKFGVKFGTMKKDDPIARFYYFNKGDVIKITRNQNREKTITYRIVK